MTRSSNTRIFKPNSFTTVELLVAISMILILTGMFFLNYRFQGKYRDLTDANHVLLQKIRKTQNMAMAQSQLPTGCGTEMPSSYGLYFETTDDYSDIFDIFADIDGEGDYDYQDQSVCICDTGNNNECIERTFLSSFIRINKIIIGKPGDYVENCTEGWASFILNDSSVTIGYAGCAPPADSREIKIETCIASEDCTLPENIKTITINNKGMVEIED